MVVSRILVDCPVHSETHSHVKEERELEGGVNIQREGLVLTDNIFIDLVLEALL